MMSGGADGICIPRTTSHLQKLETIHCPSSVINLKQFKLSLCNRSSCWLFNSVSEFHTRPSSCSWPYENQNKNIHNCGTEIGQGSEWKWIKVYAYQHNLICVRSCFVKFRLTETHSVFWYVLEYNVIFTSHSGSLITRQWTYPYAFCFFTFLVVLNVINILQIQI